MEISFARTATKHRVPRSESLRVLRLAEGWMEAPGPRDSRWCSRRRLYVGEDSQGRWLEVIAVELDDRNLKIIHAMPLRRKTRDDWFQ